MNQERVAELVKIFESKYSVKVLRKVASKLRFKNSGSYTAKNLHLALAEYMVHFNMQIPEEYRQYDRKDNHKKKVPTEDGEVVGRNKRLTRDVKETNQAIIDHLIDKGVEWNITFNDQVRDNISTMFLISPPEVTGVNDALRFAMVRKHL